MKKCRFSYILFEHNISDLKLRGSKQEFSFGKGAGAGAFTMRSSVEVSPLVLRLMVLSGAHREQETWIVSHLKTSNIPGGLMILNGIHSAFHHFQGLVCYPISA